MKTTQVLKDKTQVKDELNKAGIEICLTRSIGFNAFQLIYESYGFFIVNAKEGTDYNKVQEFTKRYENINICINH